MRKRAKLLLSGGLWMFACLAMPGASIARASVMSDAAPIDFSIPAQPLATALIAFGKQANVQVLTAGCTIARFRSLGATGKLSAPAALSKLLDGTGLVYEFTDQGTVVVTLPAAAGNTASSKPRQDAKQLTPVEANALLGDRKSTRLNSSHAIPSRMPSSA